MGVFSCSTSSCCSWHGPGVVVGPGVGFLFIGACWGKSLAGTPSAVGDGADGAGEEVWAGFHRGGWCGLGGGHSTDPEWLGGVLTGFNSAANSKGKKCPPALAGLLVLQNTKTFSWLFCSPGRAVNSQRRHRPPSHLGLHDFGRSWQGKSVLLRRQNSSGSGWL